MFVFEKKFEETHEAKRLLLIDREQALETSTALDKKGKTFYQIDTFSTISFHIMKRQCNILFLTHTKAY